VNTPDAKLAVVPVVVVPVREVKLPVVKLAVVPLVVVPVREVKVPVVAETVGPVISRPETCVVNTPDAKLAVVPVTVRPETVVPPWMILPDMVPVAVIFPVKVGFCTKPETGTLLSTPPSVKVIVSILIVP
jgi:hypothetical protein